MRWLLLTVPIVLMCACDTSKQDDDPAAQRRDAMVLQAVLGGDRTPALMTEAERAMSQRKPVHAASLIEAGVVPELQAQLVRVRDAQLATVSLRRLQLRMVAAYEQRLSAIEDYRAVLATGALDDPRVVDALRRQRDAERALLSLDEELAAIRPVHTSQAP